MVAGTSNAAGVSHLNLQAGRGARRGLDIFRSAAPTLCELGLQPLAAGSAGPGSTDRRRRGSCQSAEREAFIGIVHVKLRPRFHHRQIAHRARQILVAQLALNPGGNEHVARVSNLQQGRGSVHSFQGIFSLAISSPAAAGY